MFLSIKAKKAPVYSKSIQKSWNIRKFPSSDKISCKKRMPIMYGTISLDPGTKQECQLFWFVSDLAQKNFNQ